MTVRLASPEFLLPNPQDMTAEALAVQLQAMRRGGHDLRRLSSRHVIELLARWVEHWRQPDFFWRRQAVTALHDATGFSLPVLEQGLDELFGAWTQDAMIELVRWELGADWLEGTPDTPVSMEGFARRHLPPQVVGVILAGNVPPPALQALMAGLLVHAPVFLKAASEDPWFPAVLVGSLQSVVPELGEHVGWGVWPGPAPQTDVLLRRAEVVIGYGSDSTMKALRARAPAYTRLIEHGHRMSLAYVAREGLRQDGLALLGLALARDVALYDQQGCLSPHVILVERGGEVPVQALCEQLVQGSLPEVARKWPPGRLSLGQAAAIVQFKGVVAFTGELWEGEGGSVCLVTGDRFEPSCLGRVILVKEVDMVQDAAFFLEPMRHHIQGIALEADESRWGGLASRLAQLGASRICRPGQLQSPTAAWTGDGRPVLRDLTRLVTFEP